MRSSHVILPRTLQGATSHKRGGVAAISPLGTGSPSVRRNSTERRREQNPQPRKKRKTARNVIRKLNGIVPLGMPEGPPELVDVADGDGLALADVEDMFGYWCAAVVRYVVK